MLVRPKGFNFLLILSISPLKAVIWITKDFFVLSNPTQLYFVHNFLALLSFTEDPVSLKRANSLNKIFGSFLEKSATL